MTDKVSSVMKNKSKEWSSLTGGGVTVEEVNGQVEQVREPLPGNLYHRPEHRRGPSQLQLQNNNKILTESVRSGQY